MIAGSALIADWQTLGEDFCKMFSPFHHSVLCEDSNYSTLNSSCVEMQTTAYSSNWTAQASELCQATQGCHWNRFSVLSNSLCINCPAICRGIVHSLNIIQFSLGAVLFVMAIPVADVGNVILRSNNLHKHEQVSLTLESHSIYSDSAGT